MKIDNDQAKQDQTPIDADKAKRDRMSMDAVQAPRYQTPDMGGGKTPVVWSLNCF